MSNAASAVTNVRAKKELEEAVDMCTQAQIIITFNSKDAKELLDQVERARALVARFKGVGRTELEDAMFHQACAARDLDLTPIQREILSDHS